MPMRNFHGEIGEWDLGEAAGDRDEAAPQALLR